MRTIAICLAIAVLGPIGPAGAQWVQTNGPYGGDVRCMAIIPAGDATGTPTIFLGTYSGGVFRSTDRGTTWTGANSGLSHPAVSALAVSLSSGGTGGSTLFAGTCGGIYRSTDAGASWEQASVGLMNMDTRSLAVSPGDGSANHILAGTAGGGVYLSTDNGETWRSTGIPNACVVSMVAGGTTLIAGEPSPQRGGG